MRRLVAVILGGVCGLALAGCISERSVYAYPPIRPDACLRLPKLSRKTLTEDVLSAILERHARSVPDAVEATLLQPEHDRVLETGTTEKGLIRVRVYIEDFERLLSGHCTVRIVCRRDGQWYERSVSMKDMLARADLQPPERAVVATCDSLFVVGGWHEIE